jgi:hypothetical protein
MRRLSDPLRPILLPMNTMVGIVSEAKATPEWTLENIDKLIDLAYKVPIQRRTTLFYDVLHSIEVDYWTWGVDDAMCKRLVSVMDTL